jgi:hypothetical protein
MGLTQTELLFVGLLKRKGLATVAAPVNALAAYLA